MSLLHAVCHYYIIIIIVMNNNVYVNKYMHANFFVLALSFFFPLKKQYSEQIQQSLNICHHIKKHKENQ